LSYDHRLIDGADAIRFLRWVVEAIEQPFPSFPHRLMAQTTQIAVLGAGPGGYAAAFYAADLGMQVTLIDEEKNPGGVCLYRGCIPSKALLHVAKVVDEAAHASEVGRHLRAPPRSTWTSCAPTSRAWWTSSPPALARWRSCRKVNYVQGRATIAGPKSLKVAGASGETEIQFEHLILATGSHPTKIPVAGARQPAHDGLDLGPRIARRAEVALVVGGGYIGLELGTGPTRRSAARCRWSR
jgi:dihydrolipoamide dehydrogenase